MSTEDRDDKGGRKEREKRQKQEGAYVAPQREIFFSEREERGRNF